MGGRGGSSGFTANSKVVTFPRKEKSNGIIEVLSKELIRLKKQLMKRIREKKYKQYLKD